MSAFPPKADITRLGRRIRLVSKRKSGHILERWEKKSPGAWLGAGILKFATL